MLAPIQSLDLSIPPVSVTAPQYMSDYSIDGFSTERNGQANGTTEGAGCFFGRIITWTEGSTTKTGIKGGILYCGDQNWNISPQELNLAVSGKWLVYLAVEVEVNTDDDGELLLPNVKTGTKPTGDWGKLPWSTTADYPDNDNPSIPSGSGTINVPIGTLTIADGAATLDPAGCGNITITHCAGTLSHTRG